MRITKLNLVAIALAMLVIVALLMEPVLSSKIANFLDRELYRTGLEAKGVVESKESNKDAISQDDAKTFYVNLAPERRYGVIYYQFRDHLGRLRRGEDMVAKEIYDKHNPDDPISVRYFKWAPFLNKIDKR